MSDNESIRQCPECDILLEALRDAEAQCREIEDQRTSEAKLPSHKSYEQRLCDEEKYQAKIKMIERRRDCALEVLLKHQSLEHR